MLVNSLYQFTVNTITLRHYTQGTLLILSWRSSSGNWTVFNTSASHPEPLAMVGWFSMFLNNYKLFFQFKLTASFLLHYRDNVVMIM